MRYAIVSDIHSNKQAWRAVLGDIMLQDADVILCLGDVIGYGPAPVEVLDSVMQQCRGVIIGNHEAVIGGRCDADIFNDKARRIIEWTAKQVGASAVRRFAELPSDIDADTFLASHAEIVEPERFNYIESAEDAMENFNASRFEILFVGHTHISGVYVLNPATGEFGMAAPADFTINPGRRYIVNGGSVGDSRDDDPRASYCIFDEDRKSVVFRKVEFDVAAYKRDLLRSGVGYKPFFLTFFDHVTAHPEKPAHDWRMEVSREQVQQPVAAQPVAPVLPIVVAQPAALVRPVFVAPEGAVTPVSPHSDRFQHVEPKQAPSQQSWFVKLDEPVPQCPAPKENSKHGASASKETGVRAKFVIKRPPGNR